MRNLDYIVLATAIAALSACSSVNVWPFDSKASSGGTSPTPANSTEYQCSNGKRFYLRLLDNGNTAWLIYPDREVSLSKSGGSDNRYTNGVAVLTLDAREATLTDGARINYTGCKPPAPAK